MAARAAFKRKFFITYHRRNGDDRNVDCPLIFVGDGFFVFIVPGTPDHLLTDQEHPDSDTEGDSQDEVDIVGGLP